MLFSVIANKKNTNDWFFCKIDGRVLSVEIAELVKEADFLKLYDKSLESQYFQYYTLKPPSKETKESDTDRR